MGWFFDLIFCAFIGIICAFTAHYFFRIPIDNLKGIFLLGFFGWAILEYCVNKIQSGGSTLFWIFGFFLVIGIEYFFILPMITNAENDMIENPIRTSPIVTINSESQLKQTTSTPIEYYRRTYHWTYGHNSPTYTIEIPKPLYEYYRRQPHDRNYAKYAISDLDRKILNSIIMDFKENTDSKIEASHNIVAFVQSLPYFKDAVSTGYDEYPRYPIETLVDNGGDCEDTAILTAALLKEMNYDVVLFRFPKHMALGITCLGCSGTYYTYHDKQYFFLETTANNWVVGQMPSSLKGEKVIVYPI